MNMEQMSESAILAELEKLQAEFSEDDFDALESELHLRAAVLGWTGDPLKQPARSVLAAALSVKSKRK